MPTATKKATKKAVARPEPKSRATRRPAKVKRSELEALIEKFLIDQHCTLYGKAFYIGSSAKDRVEPVKFFSDFFEHVNDRLG